LMPALCQKSVMESPSKMTSMLALCADALAALAIARASHLALRVSGCDGGVFGVTELTGGGGMREGWGEAAGEAAGVAEAVAAAAGDAEATADGLGDCAQQNAGTRARTIMGGIDFIYLDGNKVVLPLSVRIGE